MLGFGVCKLLPAKTCNYLWEILARPVLEYAAEVWGGPWDEAEKFQREIGKAILGISGNVANDAIMGELGWWEL